MKNKEFSSNVPIKIVLVYSLFILLASLILYHGIFIDYAFADSYEFIWLADVSPTFQYEFIKGGRPMYGLLNQLAYGTLSDTIADLKWFRFFSLLGCILFSSQVFYFLKSLNLKTIEAGLFSFLILALPSFSVYIGWSATYQVPWGLNISFLAGIILIKALSQKFIKIGLYAIAIALVVISHTLYQPTGTAFLIPFVFKITFEKKLTLKKGIQVLFFLGLSFVIYYIVFKLNLKYHNVTPLKRSEISFIKFPYRFVKFYFRELFLLLRTSGIIIWNKLFLFLGLLPFLGFLYIIYKDLIKDKKYIVAIFLIIVAPLTCAPNLLSSQNFLSLRSIGPAAVILFFYQFYFIKHLYDSIKVFKTIAAFAALSILLIAYFNLNTYICDIQNKEYVFLKKAMSKIPNDAQRHLIFIIPEKDFLINEGFYEKSVSDEFTQTSSAKLWFSSPFFLQNLKEIRKVKASEIEPYDIQVVQHDEHFENPNNALVINLREILIDGFTNTKKTNLE